MNTQTRDNKYTPNTKQYKIAAICWKFRKLRIPEKNEPKGVGKKDNQLTASLDVISFWLPFYPVSLYLSEYEHLCGWFFYVCFKYKYQFVMGILTGFHWVYAHTRALFPIFYRTLNQPSCNSNVLCLLLYFVFCFCFSSCCCCCCWFCCLFSILYGVRLQNGFKPHTLTIAYKQQFIDSLKGWVTHTYGQWMDGYWIDIPEFVKVRKANSNGTVECGKLVYLNCGDAIAFQNGQ